MSLKLWLKLLAARLAPVRPARSARASSCAHPRVELLEERCLLSAGLNEFAIPTPNSFPFGITAGPDGNLWFTEENSNKIGRITPSGTVSEFPVPTTGSAPYGITTGPDGNLWFTEKGGNKIGRITPTGTFTEFTVTTASSQPAGITAGADGNLWFTEDGSNKIGRITQTGTITEFTVPTANSAPSGITAGADGNLWFTENNSNKIGRISTAGTVTEFTVPTASSQPAFITAGPDGNLWFTEFIGNKIGRITPTGTIAEFAIPTGGSSPLGITAAADGNLWFTENNSNKIGRISTAGTVTEFTVPTASSGSVGITAGADGNLWFTEENSNKIGRITVPTEFAIPTTFSEPEGITAGPDGNLWFAESGNNKIGRITTAGTISEFTMPNSAPAFITAGADGNLWFTDDGNNKIGRITTAGTVTEFTVPTASSTPLGITAGVDGNLWFTELNGNKIGSITPTGSIAEFTISSASSMPEVITAGADGNLWFTEFSSNKIGRITPAGTITEFTIPAAFSEPEGITAGADGNLWFTESNGNKIGRITPTGTITEFPIPTPSSVPQGITAGADGNLWFAEESSNKIGRITPAGTITEFAVLTASSAPAFITAGPDGNLWFTENSNKIGHINLLAAGSASLGLAPGQTYSGVVATVIPYDPLTQASALQALINWGDGTVTNGVLAGTGSAGFSISGTHAYSQSGTDTATVTITYVNPPSNLSLTPNTTSVSAAVTVAPSATTTVLTSDFSPAPAGQPVTYVATVTTTVPSSLTVTGVVQFWDTVSGFLGATTLSGGMAALTPPTLAAGTHTVYAVFQSNASFATSTSANLTQQVNPGPATHFLVTPTSNTAGAGTPFNFTVTALDAYNNTATGYGGTVQFTSSDGQSAFGTNNVTLPIGSGTGTFSVALKTAGNQTLTATDMTTSTILGTSAAVTVSPSTASHFAVSVPLGITAGVAFGATVTAKDQYNNVATSYTGTVHFTSTVASALATLPANTPLTQGVGTFPVVLDSAGNQTVTATDTVSGITGTSGFILVNPTADPTFTVTAPLTAVTGTSFTFTVRAHDEFDNTAIGYTGTVHFTSTDLAAMLPTPSYTFTTGSGGDDGSRAFTATFNTPGAAQSITVTDFSSTSSSNNILTQGLIVNTLTPTSSGFTATFDKPFNPSTLALYGSGTSTVVAATLTQGGIASVLSAPTIVNQGSGYTAVPTVTFAAPNGVGTVQTASFGITAASETGTTVTITTSATHGYKVGQVVTIAGIATSGYNGPFTLIAGTTGTTLKYTAAAGLGTSGSVVGATASLFAQAATGTVVLSSQKVASITIVNPGSGYTTAPTLSFSGGGGSGAVATATVATTNLTGSLLLNTADTTVTFIKTGLGVTASPNSLLANGNYLVTLVSNVNAFKDASGSLLDGNADSTPGDNYTATFAVNNLGTLATVGVADFARGPGASTNINVPNNQATGVGLPITLLTNSAAVTDVVVTLNYDPTLLTISGANANSALTGSTFTVNTATLGQAIFTFHSPTALAANTLLRLGGVVAQVPDTAPYQNKTLLTLSSISVNGSAIPAVGAAGVEVVDYLGDVNASSGTINGTDTSLVQRVGTGLDTGFAAFGRVDPLIVADFNVSGKVDGTDAGIETTVASNGTSPFIPAVTIPGGGLVLGGPDPTLSLPAVQASAGVVVLPVNLDDPRPDGSGMTEAVLALTYDSTVLTVSAADIHLGSIPLSGTGWTLTTVVDATTGQIGIDLSSLTPIADTTAGSLVTITFQVRAGATGVTAVHLVSTVDPNGQGIIRTAVTGSQGAYVLTPAPINGPQGLKGEVTLGSPAPSLFAPLSGSGTGMSGLFSGSTAVLAGSNSLAKSVPATKATVGFVGVFPGLVGNVTQIVTPHVGPLVVGVKSVNPSTDDLE